MRRLARRLFTLCSVASLLLCVALCVLWVRSYWVSDVYCQRRAKGELTVGSLRGGAYVLSITDAPDKSATVIPQPGYSATELGPDDATGEVPPNWSFAGFQHLHVDLGVIIWSLTVPYWAPVVLLVADRKSVV